ncbi:MAG: undecaprenyl-diphosphate phosphatase [bacterium]|nr:undecaprenyl-diphosphate phosphatase [bacterium]
MSIFQAILLGILQGLTEFLPVSSSGHLAIIKNLLHINLDSGMLYDVLLHVATLIAICIVFFKDVVKLIVEFFMIIIDIFKNIGIFFGNLFGRRDEAYIQLTYNSYRKFVVLIIVSTIPTGVIGYLMQDIAESAGAGMMVPGICLMISGGILLIADRTEKGRKKPKETTYLDAFTIGMCQGVATLPGITRSGTTVTACLLLGLERKFAVKYSFIMSIPAILGALILQIKDIGNVSLEAGEIAGYIIGMIVAAAVGFVCIKIMMAIVQSRKFKPFAFYCLIVGAVSVIGALIMM